MRLQGHTVLLTGGSTGIGLALARQLLAADNIVLTCGRDESRLRQAAAELPGLLVRPADLADPDDVRALAAEARALPGGPTILINNAAFQLHHDFVHDPTEELLTAIAVEIGTNLTGLVQLTAALLPALAAAPAAAVLNVTSGLIFSPKASAPVYCATKSAVHTFTTALRYQTRRHAPHVLVTEAVLRSSTPG